MADKRKWTKQELIDFEDHIGDLYLDGKLPFLFHLSGGNEDQLIKIFKGIAPNDYVLSNHRSHYHALLHGIPAAVVEDRIRNGRSMFLYDRDRNFFSSAIIGATPAIAVGIAWALKRKGSDQHVWCFIGDGTEDNGHTFEAVRYAEGFDLPVTFVIENNDRSVEASNAERWGTRGDIQWNSPKVLKYYYDITYPHARKPGMVDLSKNPAKTDNQYFPENEWFASSPDNVRKIISPDKLITNTISYKEAVHTGMDELAMQGAIFIGYNVVRGNAMGTLENVPDSQKIETPVAENLMTGLAIGMSFEGFLPVLYFERQDFVLNAMDLIINHIDKIERISHGEFKAPVIIRAVVADGGPFYSGPTHSQDFTDLFVRNTKMPIYSPKNGSEMLYALRVTAASGQPAIIVERKSLY